MDFIIEACKTAYINTMGVEKWESLTDEQKHDVIMIMAKDFNKMLDNI